MIKRDKSNLNKKIIMFITSFHNLLILKNHKTREINSCNSPVDDRIYTIAGYYLLHR
jgi:hypothetical protein